MELTNRAQTIRVTMTPDQWSNYVTKYGPRAREMGLTCAGQTVEHQRREREPLVTPTVAEIAREYVRAAGERALIDVYGLAGLTRKMAGGLLSDGALATIGAGEREARIEIEQNGVPDEFAARLRGEVVESRAFDTRCAHPTDMIVEDLEPWRAANGALHSVCL